MKRALVTGGTGFVGSELTKRLQEKGWHVEVTARLAGAAQDRAHSFYADRIHMLDAQDEKTLSDVIGAAAPDVVFHLASCFLAEHKPEQVATLIRSNVEFGALLLEAMRDHACTRLVNAGTSWQHYHSDEYKPVCLYAATKQAFEALLAYYVDAHGLQAVSLKLFDTYGPRDRRGKLMRLLERTALSGEPIAFSPGEQVVDLLHVDDATEAFLLAGERLLSGHAAGHETFALSSGERLSLRELAGLYSRCCGHPLPVRFGERPYRAREVMRPWSSGATLPGWIPRVSLEAGIRAMLADRCEAQPVAECGG